MILLPEKEGTEDTESSFSDEEDVKSRAGSPSHLGGGVGNKKQKRKHEKKIQKQL